MSAIEVDQEVRLQGLAWRYRVRELLEIDGQEFAVIYRIDPNLDTYTSNLVEVDRLLPAP